MDTMVVLHECHDQKWKVPRCQNQRFEEAKEPGNNELPGKTKENEGKRRKTMKKDEKRRGKRAGQQ